MVFDFFYKALYTSDDILLQSTRPAGIMKEIKTYFSGNDHPDGF